MATQVQFRGGTTSEHSTFTGAAREVTVDTTKKTVVVHDGSTVGGIPLAKESAVTSAAAITGGSINGTTVGASTASTGAFTTLSASSTVSGTGFSTYLASPPAIGGTTASTGRFTTVTATGLTSGRVTYAGASGLLTDSANLLYSGTDLTVYGLRVGRGGGALSTNAALGTTALGATNTGAGYAVGVGYQALQANTSGEYNTAVGGLALYTNTSGSNNSAYGFAALYSNSSGTANVAVGRESLNQNTTASNITAVGYQAGYTQTTGSGGGSVFVGYRAGYSGNGYQQTIVGNDAGLLSTGSNNTFIGMGSGSTMTSGTGNTILGRFDGNQDGLDIRTLADYIVLSDGNGARQITMKEGQTLALDSAIPQTGTGITFPATQNASSNANTLDDYEEGTFTPVLGTSNGDTATMSVQEGKYVKVGKIVQFTIQVVWTAKNTWSFNTRISGLPFTATLNTGGYVWANACQMDANVLTAPFTYGIESNSTYGYIQAINVTGAQLTESSFPSSGRVLVNGCYQTP